MKFLTLCFVLILSIDSQAAWQDWSLDQKKTYVASNVLLIADWSTTRDMTRRYHEGYFERNPILGKHPSSDKLDLYFVSLLIGHYFMTDYLQGRDREIYLYTVTAVEAAAVANNLHIGLRLRF